MEESTIRQDFKLEILKKEKEESIFAGDRSSASLALHGHDDLLAVGEPVAQRPRELRE